MVVKRTGGNQSEGGEIHAVMDEFLRHYFEERDVEKTLAMLSEQFCSVGTGGAEIAIGREAFRGLMTEEIAVLPGPLHYTVSDFVQIQRAADSWSCVCNVELRMAVFGGMEMLYHIRMTAGLRRAPAGYVIDIIHASEASKYQKEGEFFPFRFLSQEAGDVNAETQRQLMEIITQVMPGGVMSVYTEEGYPLYMANERLLHLTGYPTYEAFRQDMGGLILNSIHPEDRRLVSHEWDRLLRPGDQCELRYRMKKQNGDYFWVQNISRKTVAAAGRGAIISVLIDISEQVRLNACLQKEVAYDPLTGVYNRKGGRERIMQTMQEAHPYLFLMLDLDNFKMVNDTYGHEQGDQVLRIVAKQMADTCRKSDTICRLGGDEFAVFIDDCRDVGAFEKKIAEMMRRYEDMMRTRWPEAGSTLSVGGVYGDRPCTFEELYRLADEVLYEMKKSGKGQVKIRAL